MTVAQIEAIAHGIWFVTGVVMGWIDLPSLPLGAIL